jgi:hypothetical protein
MPTYQGSHRERAAYAGMRSVLSPRIDEEGQVDSVPKTTCGAVSCLRLRLVRLYVLGYELLSRTVHVVFVSHA